MKLYKIFEHSVIGRKPSDCSVLKGWAIENNNKIIYTEYNDDESPIMILNNMEVLKEYLQDMYSDKIYILEYIKEHSIKDYLMDHSTCTCFEWPPTH